MIPSRSLSPLGGPSAKAARPAALVLHEGTKLGTWISDIIAVGMTCVHGFAPVQTGRGAVSPVVELQLATVDPSLPPASSEAPPPSFLPRIAPPSSERLVVLHASVDAITKASDRTLLVLECIHGSDTAPTEK